MWKRLLLVTAVSAAMSSMAIAAPLTVGFSQVGSESGWRAAETSVAKEEAAKRGITLKIADGQQKQENQIKAVRSFIAQGVDAIFIAPVVATGWEPVLKEAKEAKIPVFLLDRSIDVKDKDLYMTTVTANNVLEGQLIGDWLVKTVDGKPCNVVELQGTVGASVAIDRKKGFAEAIKNAPNIKIIRSQSGDFTRSKGKEVMESFIKAENCRILILRLILKAPPGGPALRSPAATATGLGWWILTTPAPTSISSTAAFRRSPSRRASATASVFRGSTGRPISACGSAACIRTCSRSLRAALTISRCRRRCCRIWSTWPTRTITVALM